MRIHLVTDAFTVGGGLEHIFQIVNGFPQIQFTVFGQSGPCTGKFKNLTNVKIHDAGFSPAQVMAHAPDLVHIHHLKPLLAFYKNPFVHYHVPVIFTAHGLHIHKYEFYPQVSARIQYALRFHLEKYLYQRVNKIIAVSREDARFLEHQYHLEHVHYIANGIDFARVKAASVGESKAHLRQRLALPVSSFLFVTVARFHFQKAYDFLIRAIALLKETINQTSLVPHFVLVGDGDQLAEMKRLSQQLEVSSLLTFLGSRSDVYDIMQAADVFLLPSRWEGLPIVLLEAGLLKIPVLASDTYGNREMVTSKNGILFPNGQMATLVECIKTILANPGTLNALATNMFHHIHAEYSLEKMLAKLNDLYYTTTSK